MGWRIWRARSCRCLDAAVRQSIARRALTATILRDRGSRPLIAANPLIYALPWPLSRRRPLVDQVVVDDDVAAALAFLRRDPLINVYLISRILEERFASSTQTVEVRHNREIVLVASLATNIVLAGDPRAAAATSPRPPSPSSPTASSRACCRCAPSSRRRTWSSCSGAPAHAARSADRRADESAGLRDPRPARLPDLKESRYATMRDLDALVPACAAMHQRGGRDRSAGARRGRLSRADPRAGRAEALRDPRRRRPDRREVRVLGRDERHRAVDGRLDAIRVSAATATPARCCARSAAIFARKGKTVTLFVNDFNHPAIALYERLGFQRIGMNRALIW